MDSSSTIGKSNFVDADHPIHSDWIRNQSTVRTGLEYCTPAAVRDCNAKNKARVRSKPSKTLKKRQPPTYSSILGGHLDEVTKQLCCGITGQRELSGIYSQCWNTYIAYLHSCISRIWAPIITRVAIGLEPDAQANSTAGRLITYKMLVQTQHYLRDVRQCSLGDLVASLRVKDLIKDDLEPLALQMVFLFVGWLTALFDPLVDRTSRTFAIVGKEEKSLRRQTFCRPVIRNTCVEAAVANQPLYRLISRFGILLPQIELDFETIESRESRDVEVGGQNIDTALISFQKLKETLKIRIEWVQTVNQHLEFDQQTNTLRLFRFPSLLWLLYQHKDRPLLTRLCEDNRRELSSDDESPHSRIRPVEVILIEIIISYHLIFGRNWRSRRSIGRIFDKQRKSLIENGQHDPLLESLCSKDRGCDELREIYEGLDEDETKFGPFVEAQEFPFLGRRLLKLQQVSIGQNPRSLRRLWNDSGSYHAIRIAVTFGSGAMVLVILQLCFQIWPVH